MSPKGPARGRLVMLDLLLFSSDDGAIIAIGVDGPLLSLLLDNSSCASSSSLPHVRFRVHAEGACKLLALLLLY